jgi:hypothetical protein
LRSLGGVSFPCWPVTPAVSPVSRPPWAQYHTRREPSITPAMSPVSSLLESLSEYPERPNNWQETCQTTLVQWNVCHCKLDRCNNQRTCETLTSNETAETPLTLLFYLDLKPDDMQSKLNSV